MPVGWPDLFARHVEKRVCVWIEVKRPGENLSPEQLEFQLDALAAGERHWIIMSLNELTFQLARV
jgi:VRR-NUC domain.